MKQDMKMTVKEVPDAGAKLDGGDVLFTGKYLILWGVFPLAMLCTTQRPSVEVLFSGDHCCVTLHMTYYALCVNAKRCVGQC